jgi:glutamate formiminotransferase/formiminotetrahydrofolate cyclodeaminase
MVATLTVGRKKYAEVEKEVSSLLERAAGLRTELTAAISQDADAFDNLMAVWRDKDLDDDEKAIAIEEATKHAGEVPLAVARLSREAAEIALSITSLGNVNAVTDAAAAAVLARSAVQIAAMNVKINAVGLRDQALAQAWRDELASLEADAERLSNEAIGAATERGGF